MKRITNVDEAQSSKINFMEDIVKEFHILKAEKNDDMQILLNFEGLDLNTINDIINGFVISLAPTNYLLKQNYYMFIENLSSALIKNDVNKIQYFLSLEEKVLKDTFITIIIEE
jgi:hypothetical protein